jgi:hypothetical protein
MAPSSPSGVNVNARVGRMRLRSLCFTALAAVILFASAAEAATIRVPADFGWVRCGEVPDHVRHQQRTNVRDRRRRSQPRLADYRAAHAAFARRALAEGRRPRLHDHRGVH